ANIQAQILPYMEQAAMYSAFNLERDVGVFGPTAVNNTAQTQIVASYNCPSDGQSARLTVTAGTVTINLGYANYFWSAGASASPEGANGTPTAFQEGNAALLGPFSFPALDRTGTFATNPNFRVTKPTKLA